MRLVLPVSGRDQPISNLSRRREKPAAVLGARPPRPHSDCDSADDRTRTSRGNFGLLALALDLAVPPLALLGVLLTFVLVVTGSAALLGVSSAALIISAASFAAFMFAVLLRVRAWARISCHLQLCYRSCVMFLAS